MITLRTGPSVRSEATVAAIMMTGDDVRSVGEVSAAVDGGGKEEEEEV